MMQFAARALTEVVDVSRSATIAVLGHYGQLNLGDESITAAAIAGVRAVRPDARLIGISLDPRDTTERHGVESFALRREISRTPVDRPRCAPSGVREKVPSGGLLRRTARSVPGLRATVRALAGAPAMLVGFLAEARALRACWRALEGVEVLIIAGSNQLLDQFGGAWGFPYTLLKWTILARLRGARVVLLSVGAGPLDGWLARRFVLWTLGLADYASVRDPGSAQLVERIGWRRSVLVRPDLALGLDTGRSAEPLSVLNVARTSSSPESLTVGVNLAPVHDPRYWPGDKPHVRTGYLDAMAGFVERLLAEGHRVELYGTQPADEWVAEELIERIAPADPRDSLSLARIRTLDQLQRLYRRCDIIAATRFHGILLALRFVRPVIGICYYRKSRELLRDFGIERYAFDLDRVTAADLGEAFAAIAAERQAMERLLRDRVASRADDLFEQYRRVLSVSTAEAVQV